MNKSWSLGRWGACALVALAAGVARADAFEDACAAARAKQQPALVELATWCHERKLFATRNELARAILAQDPDHTAAHRWLRHRLGAGGVWEAPKRSKPARDLGPEALAELPAIRSRLLGEVAATLHAALEDHAELVTPGRREATLSEITVMVPDDAEYRTAHGEVQTENGWRLAETVTGAMRREELRLAARKALADAGEPTDVAPPSSVSAASLRWKGGVATAEVRAYSTTSEAEARAMARGCQAVPDYLRVALDFETRVVPGLTLYALAERTQAERIFNTHPASDEHARARWNKYACLWIGNAPEVATYYPDGPSRLESVVSQEIVYLLLVEYAGELKDATWLLNGFDRRLAWEIVGTRLTYSRTESEYAHSAEPWANWGELTNDGWYERARESLEAASPADLAEILGRPMNLISIRDDVVLNALAAYYIEGRPQECGDLFASAAAGKGPHDALRIASNLDIEALRLRLIRWLRERRPS